MKFNKYCILIRSAFLHMAKTSDFNIVISKQSIIIMHFMKIVKILGYILSTISISNENPQPLRTVHLNILYLDQ